MFRFVDSVRDWRGSHDRPAWAEWKHLLEPVMRVEVVVPKDYMGDVMGDLASRRGRIQSQEDRGGTQIISSRVPLSEMFGYATDLRSRTQGRATYSMHFDRYEQAPPDVSGEIVAKIQGTPTK